MARALLLSKRRHAGRIGLLLVLALLFAQTGALLHQYSHLRTPGDPPPVSGQYCADCLSFSPLLTTAGGASQGLTIAPAQPGVRYRSPSLPSFSRSSPNAFLPRGPPTSV